MQRRAAVRGGRLFEVGIAGVALLSLIAAQLTLSAAFPASNYYGGDGKMAEAVVLTGLRFAGRFAVTSVNPLQGVGSQLLPKNGWANPAFWPFTFLDPAAARDVSATIALGCFATACYVMARCFALPAVVSAAAAQATILLFAPLLLIVHTPLNFCLTPGDAVVYAPYLIALGMLVRLGPGSLRRFVFTTIGITLLIFYAVYCDPLWTMVAAIAWAPAFAMVVLHPLRLRSICMRLAALACCLVVFAAVGTAVYLFTLSQYTARVQFGETLDRMHSLVYVTSALHSPLMKHFHFVVAVGLLLGLLSARDRLQTLVLAASAAWTFYIGYSVAFLLADVVWFGPIPIYLEQSLFALFLPGAAAGFWSILLCLSAWIGSGRPRGFTPQPPAAVVRLLAFATVLIVPLGAIYLSLGQAHANAQLYSRDWSDQHELEQFLADRVQLSISAPFRGSVTFPTGDEAAHFAMAGLWSRGVPTANEYSQLVAPPGFYFLHALLHQNMRLRLNQFQPFWDEGLYTPAYWKALAAFGVRFWIARQPLPPQFDPGLELVTLPHQPLVADNTVGKWYVYELPGPNFGQFSPTQVVMADSAVATMAVLSQHDFDFAKQVVIAAQVPQALVEANSARLSIIRGGLHFSGHSEGTSLVLLPQQFTHCLRAHDGQVRLVRADLMLTALIFSRDVDTDISFDYGLFSPSCRLADLRDLKALDLKIDQRMPHLTGDRRLPEWREAIAKLAEAVRELW